MQPSKLQQVIVILKEQGATDEAISSFVAELTKVGFGNLYSQAALNFTDEDLKEIELSQTEEETNSKIKEIYQKRTGQDPKVEMDKFVNTFCDGFLKEYKQSL